jgi:hypothetical protein
MDIVFSWNGDSRFESSAKEYSSIWAWDGENITRSIQRISGLAFSSRSLHGEIIDGPSQSNPLKLRFNYESDSKRETLVHELCHILLGENKLKARAMNGDLSLGIHMVLNLILFDILVDLWGEEFAKSAVEAESSRSEVYKNAWAWALKFNKMGREERFANFKNNTRKGA